jgi:hypothetical protein
MRIAIGSRGTEVVVPLALVVSAVALVAGCASGPTAARHEARVRDAWQCEAEAEEYLHAGQNTNELRYLMIESCMAMRGHVAHP